MMRGLRPFLALSAVLVALGAYIYFVESERAPGDDEDREAVFTVEADAIEEVTITSDAGERTTVRRDGDAWRIVEPIAADADSSGLSSLTSSLASLEIQRVIDEQASDLGQYGLDQPRFQVRFKAGEQEHRLAAGLKTPPGSDIYARLNDEPRVFLIAAHVESTFNKGTFDLRDKRVVRVEREHLNDIEITRDAGTIRLAQADGSWSLTAPIRAPADYSEVNGLVTQLTSAEMRSIEEAPKPDLSAYGLAKPAATVRAGSGDLAVVLHLGGKVEGEEAENAIYARVEGRADVFTVDASLLAALQKEASEFRQKDLFDARAFNTQRIEITHGGQTAVFEKQGRAGCRAPGRRSGRWQGWIAQRCTSMSSRWGT